MQKTTLQRRLSAGLAAVLLLVALAVGVAWRNTVQVTTTAAWVDHTREVLGQLETVLRLNVDAQNALRGWLISGEAGYLEPYWAARRELPEVLRRLRELSADNPGRQGAVLALQALTAEHLDYRQRLADLGREQGVDVARGSFIPGEGKAQVDRIRATVAQLRTAEERLLAERESASRDADRRDLWTLALLAALSVAIVLGAYWMLRRHLAARLRAERALRRNEENLHVTLQSIGDAVLATDVTGRVIRLNPAAERLTGWKSAEAEGRPIDEVFRIINEDSRLPAEIPVQRVLATGLVQGLANHTVLIARDGKQWPIADSAAPIRADDDSVLGVVLVFRDVSEERRAEQAIRQLNEELEERVRRRTAQLEESNRRLRMVEFTVASASVAIYWVGRDGRIERVNPAACRMLGYSERELLALKITEVNADLGPERWDEFWHEVGERRRMTFEASHRRRDGTTLPVEVEIGRLDFEGADFNVAFVRDISERRLAEQALRASEQRFRGTLDTMIEGCQIIGFDWRYLYANAAAAAQGRTRVEALVGRTMMEAFPGIESTPLFEVLQRCMKLRRAQHIENEFTFAHGKSGWFELVVQPVPEGIFILSLDISERKRAERQLRELNDDLERRVAGRTAELAAAGRELAAKNQQLEQANRLKSEFLANMSHELRTPLNAVIGFSEILGEDLADGMTAQQREFVRDIHASGTHLLALINDILDLSKIEAGSMQLDLEPVQAEALVKSCLAVVRERALARRIDLRAEVDAALDAFEGDSRKLKQIVFNLLSNAVKFTDEGGRVELSVRLADRARIDAVCAAADRRFAPSAAHGAYVELDVRDTGVGIAANDLARLFEPFVQVDASLRRRHEGTGLGLALVLRMVDLHGGGMAVASTPGLGSRFTVWLPYRPATAPAAELPPASETAARAVPLALVIEDDDAAARLLTRELEGHGFAVLRASTAEEGLVLAVKHRPDLITLDVFLPHIDGWDCLDRLKASEQTADVPVVIVSTSTQPERGLALGAVRVLQKPVARDALLGVLAQLGLDATRPAKVLVVDDDPAAVEIAATHLQAAGMQVLRAFGGGQAIALALAELPSLIVLDIMMPEVSGFDVAAALKTDAKGRTIPIVVVTAKQLTAEERALLNGQVLKVVDKGRFSGADFVAEVRRALATKSRER